MKDIYVKFSGPDLNGESADKDHAGWIEASSWEHVISQPRSATASTSGGHTAGRCDHGEMELEKTLDLVSAKLYEACSAGTTFAGVTIDFMRADGDGKRVKYLEIQLKNVLVSEVAVGVADGLPVEKFSLKYAAVQWMYTKQKMGGGEGGRSMAAWSLTKNDRAFVV
jgi:type VI secretion system secreted protein Hcp